MYLQPQSVLERLIHFQTLDLTKFFMCSVDLYMGIISDTTHIKTIFSFSPAIGKHFIGNAVVSELLAVKIKPLSDGELM